MPFTVKVDTSRAQLKFDEFPAGVRDALAVFVVLEAGELLGRVQELAGGDVLQVVSGKYLKSIKASTSVTNKRVIARIYSKDPRANLFEWGGTTPAREVDAVNAKALHFVGPSVGEVFAAHVQRPRVQYKPHTTIHAAFDEMKAEIEQGLVETVDDVARRF